MTADQPIPAAPKGLSARSRRLWRAILTDFEASEGELEVLRGALEALDRADVAAEIVKRDGPVASDRYGSPKSHPAVDVEIRYRHLFARSIAQLGMRLVDDQPPSRLHRTGPRPRTAKAREMV